MSNPLEKLISKWRKAAASYVTPSTSTTTSIQNLASSTSPSTGNNAVNTSNTVLNGSNTALSGTVSGSQLQKRGATDHEQQSLSKQSLQDSHSSSTEITTVVSEPQPLDIQPLIDVLDSRNPMQARIECLREVIDTSKQYVPQQQQQPSPTTPTTSGYMLKSEDIIKLWDVVSSSLLLVPSSSSLSSLNLLQDIDLESLSISVPPNSSSSERKAYSFQARAVALDFLRSCVMNPSKRVAVDEKMAIDIWVKLMFVMMDAFSKPSSTQSDSDQDRELVIMYGCENIRYLLCDGKELYELGNSCINGLVNLLEKLASTHKPLSRHEPVLHLLAVFDGLYRHHYRLFSSHDIQTSVQFLCLSVLQHQSQSHFNLLQSQLLSILQVISTHAVLSIPTVTSIVTYVCIVRPETMTEQETETSWSILKSLKSGSNSVVLFRVLNHLVRMVLPSTKPKSGTKSPITSLLALLDNQVSKELMLARIVHLMWKLAWSDPPPSSPMSLSQSQVQLQSQSQYMSCTEILSSLRAIASCIRVLNPANNRDVSVEILQGVRQLLITLPNSLELVDWDLVLDILSAMTSVYISEEEEARKSVVVDVGGSGGWNSGSTNSRARDLGSWESLPNQQLSTSENVNDDIKTNYNAVYTITSRNYLSKPGADLDKFYRNISLPLLPFLSSTTVGRETIRHVFYGIQQQSDFSMILELFLKNELNDYLDREVLSFARLFFKRYPTLWSKGNSNGSGGNAFGPRIVAKLETMDSFTNIKELCKLVLDVCTIRSYGLDDDDIVSTVEVLTSICTGPKVLRRVTGSVDSMDMESSMDESSSSSSYRRSSNANAPGSTANQDPYLINRMMAVRTLEHLFLEYFMDSTHGLSSPQRSMMIFRYLLNVVTSDDANEKIVKYVLKFCYGLRTDCRGRLVLRVRLDRTGKLERNWLNGVDEPEEILFGGIGSDAEQEMSEPNRFGVDVANVAIGTVGKNAGSNALGIGIASPPITTPSSPITSPTQFNPTIMSPTPSVTTVTFPTEMFIHDLTSHLSSPNIQLYMMTLASLPNTLPYFPRAYSALQHLRTHLCETLLSDRVASQIASSTVSATTSSTLSAPTGNAPQFKKADLYPHYYKLLLGLLPLRKAFHKQACDEIVLTLTNGLSRPTASKLCCQALQVSILELPLSITKLLPSVLMKMSQLSRQDLAVPILEFLIALANQHTVNLSSLASTATPTSATSTGPATTSTSTPSSTSENLLRNLVEQEWKRIFGIAVQYIRSPPTSSTLWKSFSIHLSYHVIATYFTRLKMSERRKYVPFIIQHLITGNRAGLDDENVELAIDILGLWGCDKPSEEDDDGQMGTSGSNSSLNLKNSKPLSRSWLYGNDIFTVTILSMGSSLEDVREDGLSSTPVLNDSTELSVVVRRPCGTRRFKTTVGGVNSGNSEELDLPGEVLFGLKSWLSSLLMTISQVNGRGTPIASRKVRHSRSLSLSSDLLAAQNEVGSPSSSGLSSSLSSSASSIHQNSSVTTRHRSVSESSGTSELLMPPPSVTGVNPMSIQPGFTPFSRPSQVTLLPSPAAPNMPSTSSTSLEPFLPDFWRTRPCLILPNDDATTRSLSVLDRTPVVDLHKIGVVYVGRGQLQETEILSNRYGSSHYEEFLESLGSKVTLRGLSSRKNVYTGGLDTVSDLDGKMGLYWHDELSQIIFHVATMMPTNVDTDPACNGKKRHIGNDYLTIVWNDSGNRGDGLQGQDAGYALDTISGQFCFVNIVITPLGSCGSVLVGADPNDGLVGFEGEGGVDGSGDGEQGDGVATSVPSLDSSSLGASQQTSQQQQQSKGTSLSDTLFQVHLQRRQDIPDISAISEPKIVSGQALPAFVRALAMHVNSFVQIWWQTRSAGQGQGQGQQEYISNWRERLRQIKRLRERVVKTQQQQQQQQSQSQMQISQK